MTLMAALAQTVPELKSRDFSALVVEAMDRVPHAAADFQAMPKFKNKTYALACEIALCGGQTGQVSAPSILDQIRTWLGVTLEFANGTIRTFAMPYALRE